jgi:hypothetical protein
LYTPTEKSLDLALDSTPSKIPNLSTHDLTYYDKNTKTLYTNSPLYTIFFPVNTSKHHNITASAYGATAYGTQESERNPEVLGFPIELINLRDEHT